MTSPISRIRLIGSHVNLGQRVEHRFFYARGDGMDNSQTELQESLDAFVVTVVANVITICSNSIVYTRVEAWDDTDKVFAVRSLTALEGTGTLIGESLPPYYAMKFQLDRNTFPVRSGLKFFSGALDSWFNTNGLPVDGTIEANLLVVSLALADNLTGPGPAFLVWVAAVLKNYSEVTGIFETLSGVLQARFIEQTTLTKRKPKSRVS